MTAGQCDLQSRWLCCVPTLAWNSTVATRRPMSFAGADVRMLHTPGVDRWRGCAVPLRVVAAIFAFAGEPGSAERPEPPDTAAAAAARGRRGRGGYGARRRPAGGNQQSQRTATLASGRRPPCAGEHPGRRLARPGGLAQGRSGRRPGHPGRGGGPRATDSDGRRRPRYGRQRTWGGCADGRRAAPARLVRPTGDGGAVAPGASRLGGGGGGRAIAGPTHQVVYGDAATAVAAWNAPLGPSLRWQRARHVREGRGSGCSGWQATFLHGQEPLAGQRRYGAQGRTVGAFVRDRRLCDGADARQARWECACRRRRRSRCGRQAKQTRASFPKPIRHAHEEQPAHTLGGCG